MRNKRMITFNSPAIGDLEKEYVLDALCKNKLSGDGDYTKKATAALAKICNTNNILLTTSCTDALELGALLLDLKEGDEVIVPSYTFVSTVNAIVLRKAVPVFVDIEKDTLNMDSTLIERHITSKTRAIMPVHYAGISCAMDEINAIAKAHSLYVIEDAAQAVGTLYKNKPAGTLGDIGCFSFHETKNYVMGEGGAIVVKDDILFKRAEIMREKGTDRCQFLRGQVDKYTWQDVGSSYLPSDILAAILHAQLQRFDEIMEKRIGIWNQYYAGLAPLEKSGKLTLPVVPDYSTNNAHMFYLILNTEHERNDLIAHLKDCGILAIFHYIPLHTSPYGKAFYKDSLPITEEYSARLLRLPLHCSLSEDDVSYIIEKVNGFFKLAK